MSVEGSSPVASREPVGNNAPSSTFSSLAPVSSAAFLAGPAAPMISTPTQTISGGTLSEDTRGDVEAQASEFREKGEADTALDRSKPPEAKDSPFLVTMQGREKELSPHQWTKAYRWCLTSLAGFLVLNATFASSAPANLLQPIIAHFHISEETAILLISIFVAGYCLGPLLFGPLSERYGRRPILLGSFVFATGFQLGCALSPNIGALLAFRFLAGVFASSPLTTAGALIADLWAADERGNAIAIFSLMPTAGPALAPLCSGYMAVAGVNYKWIFWLLTIFTGLCTVAIAFLLPETHAPTILHQEALRLRKETGDHRWRSGIDRSNESTTDVLKETILKPCIMFVQEPMLAVITLYMAFVRPVEAIVNWRLDNDFYFLATPFPQIYGVIYLLFEAVPIIFIRHGFNAGECGLVFLALLGGCVTGVVLYIVVPPEMRLEPVLLAAPLLPLAFFWLAWTSYPSISVASPIIALLFLGLAILYLFLGIMNYISTSPTYRTYLRNAASAIGINTIFRSAFGAGFPLFATQFFSPERRTSDGKLGVPGATSLLGGIAVVFIPVPFLLMKYGRRIRMLSKNAFVLDE